MMYEGAPDWPEKDRFWSICERRVTIFYTAPTAIRAFMKWGPLACHTISLAFVARIRRRADQPRGVDVVSGKIGGNRCPIVDTWWQLKRAIRSPTPGVTETKPEAQRGHSRFAATLLDAKGKRSKWAAVACSRAGRRCFARSGATTTAT
jgi:acetyl-CoA synthetase